MENFNFWDSNVWGLINLVGVLLLGLLFANTLKRLIKPLRVSLIPTSVLGGTILLIISIIYQAITGEYIFDTSFFGGNGSSVLEMITYHGLGLGFIATAFKPGKEKFSKKRNTEIFNTGVTTVSTYLIQGSLGMLVTFIAALFISGIANYGGLLLPFGYGQGTGQALNWGNIYEVDHGFAGGKHFGLTIAALGFLSASFGGIIHLNIMRRKNHEKSTDADDADKLTSENIQSPDEIPMNGSVDKLSIQLGFVICTYMLTYFAMNILGKLIPGMIATIYGFNFLFGVLFATLISAILRALKRRNVIKKQYVNQFLMNRVGGFFFDLMVISGIAVIRLDYIKQYWGTLLIMGILGALVTYFYLRFVSKKLFPEYEQEQFLVMYGMLTGTASTGMILLREKDKDFTSPASINVVYQNLPAIVFGFPMMLLADLAPVHPYITFGILVAFGALMNLILFRSFIFKKKRKAAQETEK